MLTGRHTLASVRRAALRDRVVLYLPPVDTDTAVQRQILDHLHGSNGVILLREEDSTGFARRREIAYRRPIAVIDRYMERAVGAHGWAAQVWPAAVRGFMAAHGFDLERLRADTTPAVHDANTTAALTVTLHPVLDTIPSDSMSVTAPNIIGYVQGSDSMFRQFEFVVVVAHMDDDHNGLGVAGLIALAKAFAQSGTPPRRPIVFAAVSGSTNQHWGTNFLLGNSTLFAEIQPISPKYIAVAINLDQLAAAPNDSLLIDGLRDLDFVKPPTWVTLDHQDLGVAVADGGSVVNADSDHFVFVREAVPSLYVHTATHSEHRPTSADAAAIDATARRLQLLYHIIVEIANAERRPRWTPEGRRQRQAVLGD